MTDILVTRRIGRYKGGEVIDVDLDAYWNAHIEAGNVELLDDEAEAAPDPEPEIEISATYDNSEDFLDSLNREDPED